jgi:S1-C subfamily serine protease
MKKTIFVIVSFFLCISYANAAEESKTFRIMTESEAGDYIGNNESWDFSDDNNSNITVVSADENSVVFRVEDFEISNMSFEFASEDGESLSPGLYLPAKRFAFRDSYNGINISGNGRGCNKILGAFYVHEYELDDGNLEKAAIDFVQICEPGSSEEYTDSRPKLYGSLRYGSQIADSCNSQGCDDVKQNFGFTDTNLELSNTQTLSDVLNIDNNENIILDVSDLPKADAHKAIVKINSYALNSDYELTLFSSGSGVIINSQGLVLTNHHVAILEDDYDNSERDTSYIVCLTEDISQEPECKYTAKLIASDDNLDIALLKIENITGYSNKNSFSFLNLNASDTTSVNDEITAMGYPAIGGDTITITKGVISGKESKYNKNWLKTDAVISYGSSGGAAIDTEARIVGITSSSHSDTLGSLGYIINVSSLNDWIDSNRNKNPRINSLTSPTIELAKKIINYKNSNEFINTNPGFKITKPAEWDFTFEDETILGIDKSSDDDGGAVVISNFKFPYVIDTDIVAGNIYRNFSFLISMASIIKNEDVSINGVTAKKVIISAAGQQNNYYYIPVGNYLLVMLYDYGKDDKDKSVVDGIINSLTLTGVIPYSEVKEYEHKNPDFSIKVNDDWVLLPQNSNYHPLFMLSKSDKMAFADIEIEKTDDNTKNLNNEEYLTSLEQQVKESNSLGNVYDFRTRIIKKDAHYKLNDNLNDVIMMDTVNESISTGQVMSQNIIYYIKSGDKYIYPSLNYFGDDNAAYDAMVNKFNTAISTLKIGLTQEKPSESISLEMIIDNKSLYDSLRGKIILKVEDNGEAFYVNPNSQEMFYLGRPDDAFSVMRGQGVGITNDNLEKIPLGLTGLSGPDADGDGLSDLFEDAIGTNKHNSDTDKDGYNDKQELMGAYNPNGTGKISIDNNFANSQKGKIFLQIERNGEAWYVNPVDGKRYFLGRPDDAFQVMRTLGLGISNSNFESL